MGKFIVRIKENEGESTSIIDGDRLKFDNDLIIVQGCCSGAIAVFSKEVVKYVIPFNENPQYEMKVSGKGDEINKVFYTTKNDKNEHSDSVSDMLKQYK